MNEFTLEISDNTKNNAVFQSGVYRDSDGELQLERFHIVKSLDKDGELVTTAISDKFRNALLGKSNINLINATAGM